MPLLALVPTYTKVCQNTRRGEYPRKTVGSDFSQSNQLRNKLDMHHYIGCILSLKVTTSNLLAAVSVLNVNPRKLNKESLLLTELLCSFNNN